MNKVHVWAWKPGKPLRFRWRHSECLQFPLLFAFMTDNKTQVFVHGLASILWLHFFFILVCFKRVWQNSSEKGYLCFSWLCQSVSGGRGGGGKGGDYNVCMQTERLLAKHMACLLQRSKSTAKPRSRRGYIPRDPEGDCVKVAATQEGSANCSRASGRRGSFWKERENRGKTCFQNFCLSASSRRSAFALF